MEDEVPLVEAMGSPDIWAAAGTSDQTRLRLAIAQVLSELVDEKRWLSREEERSTSRRRFRRPRRCSCSQTRGGSTGGARNEERVFFVTAENVPPGERPPWLD